LARLSSHPDFRRRYSEANNSYRDERVRAIFAMAPGLAPVFTPESLGKISIPVARKRATMYFLAPAPRWVA
jgi:predicted dienelactone hydrolase